MIKELLDDLVKREKPVKKTLMLKASKLSKEKKPKSKKAKKFDAIKTELAIYSKESEEYKEISLPKLIDMEHKLDELERKIDEISLRNKEAKKELWQECLDITNGRCEEFKKEIAKNTILKVFKFVLIKLKNGK